MSPAARTSENDPTRNEHGETAGKEVLAHLGFGPAFPGILKDPDPDPDPAAIAMTPPGCRVEQQLLVSLGIARWIGIVLEAHYGNAQVKFSWRADVTGLPVLAIEDDPWQEEPQTQPRLVYPDEQGRYALADCWVALTDEQAADWIADHAAVLDELAATEPAPDAPATIIDYLQLGHAHRDFDPDGHIRGIRRALADYADTGEADPLVDVIADPDPASGIGVVVFLNGRPVPTSSCVVLGAGTGVTSADRDAIYDAIEQAEAVLTPPAAALVRDLLEPRVPAPTSSWARPSSPLLPPDAPL
ncbi:hypothetical protein [Amycolatopsis sp. NPDC004378]